MRKAYILSMIMAMVALNANAASKIGTFGAPNGDGTYSMEVFDDRSIKLADDASILMAVESATTNDTLTSVDCGKTFIVNPATTTVTFSLPIVVDGCGMRFVAANGSATKKFILNPDDTNMFRGLVNSAAPTTLALGDSVISPGNTADSIFIFSDGDTIWDIVDLRGTFVDNN